MQQCVGKESLFVWHWLVENRQAGKTNTVVVSLIPTTVVLRLSALYVVKIQNPVVLLVELRLWWQLDRSDWKL